MGAHSLYQLTIIPQLGIVAVSDCPAECYKGLGPYVGGGGENGVRPAKLYVISPDCHDQ